MRYKVAAFDYDGTLAEVGAVSQHTRIALSKLQASGRKLALVTGRRLDDVLVAFPEHEIFDCIVAENGAILYWPKDKRQILLTQPADRLLVEELATRGVEPLSVGRCVIATYAYNKTALSEVINELSLDYAIIFNKEHAMALPIGVDKGSGFEAALKEWAISLPHTVGFGDAENDEVLLAKCGYGVAVQNAVPGLKVIANYVTHKERGAGVVEAIDLLLTDEFMSAHKR